MTEMMLDVELHGNHFNAISAISSEIPLIPSEVAPAFHMTPMYAIRIVALARDLQAKYDALSKNHNTLIKEVEYAIGLPHQNHELNRIVAHYKGLKS